LNYVRGRADLVLTTTREGTSVLVAVAGELDAIQYASTAVVVLVYPEGTAERLPDRTGFVVPAKDGMITACTWLSRKWPSDAFGDRAVVRCFVGSAVDPEPLGLETVTPSGRTWNPETWLWDE